ncbi:dienelactone hydrolase family protein [Aquabacter sp. CN5-332]|uniref:dienelactone hydrolase family protein n=1 Tax=Aquabacter sp. CN5-332 TaxID=3156608 RepID=UPI0032B4DCD6
MPLQHITLPTQDGTCPAALASPAQPRAAHPGVILYMDAFGPRPALYDMAKRLADNGYFVLVPDLYYRVGDYGTFDAKTAFADEETGKRLRGIMAETKQALTERDGAGFIAALTEAGAAGKIGTVGYCMGGARALIAAAAYPERIAAAASFHGGNLASDAPDSPHLHAATIKARVYAGSAGVDGSFPPEQSARLALALREAEVDHTLENYVGMGHGWAVSDHRVYDPAGAERHWTRLLTLFDETL